MTCLVGELCIPVAVNGTYSPTAELFAVIGLNVVALWDLHGIY